MSVSEHLFGVCAVGVKRGEFVYNTLTVGGVCYAKPARIGVEYLYGSFAVLDKGVDAQGDEEFSLGSVDVAVEEATELAVAVLEVVGCEAPEVH